MSIKATGYTQNTPLHYIVDAGAVYKNLEFDKEGGGWKGEPLGATADGNALVIEQEYRNIEVDGVFVDAIGQKVMQTSKAMLTVNVKEITAENIKLAINGTVREADEDEAPEGYQIVEGKGRLDCGDYIKNLGLVGTLSGSTQPVIILLENALCTSGLEMETEDDDEAVIPMEFTAHAAADAVADRKVPCKIFFPPVDRELVCEA